jgi:hypothetical protein
VGGVVERVAEQQAQDCHLALRVSQSRHRRDHVARSDLTPARPGRRLALGQRVAGHGGQPGARLALGARGCGEPAGGAVEHLRGEVGGLGGPAGPGQEVAVDAGDLGVVEEGERLAVAGGGAFEQGALARQLGGHVAVPARAGGVWAS